MIDTNALLSICFTLITNFAREMPINETAVPKSASEMRLVTYWVSHDETHFFAAIVDNQGDGFIIQDGVVRIFAGADSNFYKQGQGLPSEPIGRSSRILTSDEVIEVASNALYRLLKTADHSPLTNGPAVATPAKDSATASFKVSFRSVDPKRYENAVAEVDASTAQIVAITASDPAFSEPRLALHLIPKFYTRDDPDARVPIGPQPSAGYLRAAFLNYLTFCATFGLNPGKTSSGLDVNKHQTFRYLDPRLSTNVPICEVELSDHYIYESIGGTVFSYFSEDSYFAYRWIARHISASNFNGTISKQWEDLAVGLEKDLVEKAGVSPDYFTKLRPLARGFERPALGAVAFRRAMIDWWPPSIDPKRLHPEMGMRGRPAMSAEFDLGTGEIKCFKAFDPELVRRLSVFQKKVTPDDCPPGTLQTVHY